MTLLLSSSQLGKTNTSTTACATGSARYVPAVQCSSLPPSTIVTLDLCLDLFNAVVFLFLLLFGLDYCPDSPIYFLPIYFIFALCLIPYFQDGVLKCTKNIID